MITELSAIVGERRVLERRSALVAYASDGLPGYNLTPGLAVFPGTRDELVQAVVSLVTQPAWRRAEA